MKLFIGSFSLLLFSYFTALGQKNLNNHVWRFGIGAEIRFDTATDQPIVSNNVGNRPNYNLEGCAIANDPTTGSVLFYTDGVTVYNRNNTQMPNGNAIGSNTTNTTAQSALIVPIPDCRNTRFYVFTNDASHNGSPTTPGNLRYSIVDMTLNGGLGDITVKGQLIRTDLDEAMCIAYNPNTNVYWLLSKIDKINTYIVIKISDNPLDFTANTKTYNLPPQASSGVPTLNNTFGMHYSPTAKKVGIALWSPSATVATFDFNPITGVASNCQVLDNNALNALGDRTTSPIYDVAWSPDGTKLYASNLGSSIIYQYDLNRSPMVRSTIFSDPLLVQSAEAGGFKLGPDGRLYYRFSIASGNIHRINNPNLAGALCNFQQNVLNVGSAVGAYQFPEHAEFQATKTATTNPTSLATICFGDSIALNALSNTADSIRWNTGEKTNQIFLKQPGVYSFTAFYFDYCRIPSNTVSLNQFPKVIANAGTDKSVQCGQTVNLNASATGGSGSGYQFKWLPNGPSTPNWNNRSAGLYNVQVTDNNACKDTAQVRVSNIGSSFSMSFSGNRKICNGAQQTLSPVLSPSTGNYSYLWSNGSTTPSINITVSTDTSYSVKVTDLNTSCTDEQTLSIEVIKPFIDIELSGDTAFCSGKNLILSATGADQYNWSTGSTDTFIVINNPGIYFVNYSKGGCASVKSDEILIQPSLIANAGKDSLVPCGTAITLQGNATNGSGQFAYKWVNGPNTASYPNVGAGDYTLIVTDVVKKCVDTAMVNIQNSNASFQATLAKDTTACFESNITLKPVLIPPTGNYSYLWSNGSTSPSITIKALRDSSFSVQITDNAFGCSLSKTSNLNTDSAFAEIEIIGSNPFCSNDSILLRSKFSNTSYLWSNGETGKSIVVKRDGIYTLNTSKNKCTNTSSPITIGTIISPEPSFTTNKDSLNIDEVLVISNKTPDYKGFVYNWIYGDGTADQNRSPKSPSYKQAQSYLIQLLVQNQFCQASLSKSITVVNGEEGIASNFDVLIPNAFSPNGDGINDELEIQGLGTSSIQYGIFSRWGGVIFATNSSFVKWNGTDGAGLDVNDGVYILIYEATSNTGEKKIGTRNITLIR